VYSSVWINVVSILAMFEISRAVDTAPDEVLVSEEQFTNTTVWYGHLTRLIVQQADNTCLPVGPSRSRVQSSRPLRKQRSYLWDYTRDETSYIGMVEILDSCPLESFKQVFSVLTTYSPLMRFRGRLVNSVSLVASW
jgi:hypothetical protein